MDCHVTSKQASEQSIYFTSELHVDHCYYYHFHSKLFLVPYNAERSLQSNLFTFAIEIYFAPPILSGNVRAQLPIHSVFVLSALVKSKNCIRKFEIRGW